MGRRLRLRRTATKEIESLVRLESLSGMKSARVGRLLAGQFTMNGPHAVGSVTASAAFFLGPVWGRCGAGVGPCGAVWFVVDQELAVTTRP